MYIKSSPLLKVNDARKEIFCKKNQSMENLPPTKNALIQHIKRSVYQTGIWVTSFDDHGSLPSASLFGWQKKENQWQPVWITIAEVALSFRDLVKCGCKKNCSTKRYSCKSADLPCTQLCKCKCSQGNTDASEWSIATWRDFVWQDSLKCLLCLLWICCTMYLYFDHFITNMIHLSLNKKLIMCKKKG